MFVMVAPATTYKVWLVWLDSQFQSCPVTAVAKARPTAAVTFSRNLFKSVRNYTVCSRPKPQCYHLIEFIWRNSAKRVTGFIRNLDPYRVVFGFLRDNCTLGLIPYSFSKETNPLRPPSFRKWMLWFLVAVYLCHSVGSHLNLRLCYLIPHGPLVTSRSTILST